MTLGEKTKGVPSTEVHSRPFDVGMAEVRRQLSGT